MQRREKIDGFKFGIFIGRFPSDGAANIAVKGLKISHTGSDTIVWTQENTAHTDRNGLGSAALCGCCALLI